MTQSVFKYRDSSGNLKEGFFSLNDYRIAADNNMTPSMVVNARHGDFDPAYGSAFHQGQSYLGIFPRSIPERGIIASSVRDVLDGTCASKLSGLQLATGATIVSPNTPIGNSTPVTRLWFAETIRDFIESEMQADYGMEEAAFNGMFAINETINSEVWTQPVIDVTAPGAQDFRSIAQNSLPSQMVSITASQTSKALGAVSLGLQISDQALRSASFPLVATIVQSQARGARIRTLFRALNDVIVGNKDAGESALQSTSFKTAFDTSAAANTITHAGYLRMLWNPERTYAWDYLIGRLDAYMAIENRTGRPLVYDASGTPNRGNEGTYGINPGNPQLINFAAQAPRFLAVPEGVIPGSQILALDSRDALMRVTNVAANFAETERQVMQRTNFWRWDFSEIIVRFREEALALIDYSNPG